MTTIIDKNYLVAKHNIGRIYETMGNYNKALSLYKTCLKQAVDLSDEKIDAKGKEMIREAWKKAEKDEDGLLI